MKMMHKMIVGALGLFAGLVAVGANTVVTNGTQVVVNVDADSSMTISSTFGTEITSFLKTGGGTLTLEAANSSMTGDAEIREGIVVMKAKHALGLINCEWSTMANKLPKLKSGGAIIVKDGAQLQVGIPAQKQWAWGIHKRIVLNGTGPNGSGAIRATTSGDWNNQDRFFTYVELGSDASIVCTDTTNGYGLDFSDLKGHQLTISTGYRFVLAHDTYGGAHLSAGTIRGVRGQLSIQSETSFVSGDEGKLILDGCQLSFSPKTAFPWGIEVPETKYATLSYSGVWTNAGKNRFTGPLKVDGTLALSGSDGTSSIRFEGSAASSATSGKVNVNSGIAEFVKPVTLPNYAVTNSVVVNVSNGRLRLPVGNGGWDSASFKVAAECAKFGYNASKLTAYTAAGEDVTNSLDIAGTRLGHDGAGTFTFAGDVRLDGSMIFSNSEGTFRITGNKTRFMRYLYAVAGTMLFEDAGLLYDGDSTVGSNSWGEWYVGNSGTDADAPAKVVLKGASAFGSSVSSAWGKLIIGDTAKQGAIFEMHPNATMTNTFSVGESARSKGAIHQYGGLVRLTTMNKTTKFIGYEADSYGYYGIYGGSLSFGEYLGLAGKEGSVGIMEIGENATVSGSCSELRLGHRGFGEIYMTGGKLALYSNNGTTMPHIMGVGTAGEGGQAVLTLDGPGNPTVSDTWWGWLQLCQRQTNFTAIVNINAGVVNMNHIKRAASSAATAIRSKAYLNFNGGTFKPFTTTAMFGSGDTALDRVTVYERGAVFETPYNTEQSADTPLLAPTGRGIASIALPANHENGKYIGPPEVRITGGGGAGATAHALYDPLTLSVTNIIVTSAGWDYTSEPTVTLCSADRTLTNTCAVTLTEGTPKSGGIVKKGSNNLALNAVNTYGGDTELRDGLLKVNVPGAVPATSTVVLHGGNFSLGTGVANPTKYAVDCTYIRSAGFKTTWCDVNFTDATLEIRNTDKLPEGFEKFKLLQIGSGCKVTGNPTLTGYDASVYSVRRIGNMWRIALRKSFVVCFK